MTTALGVARRGDAVDLPRNGSAIRPVARHLSGRGVLVMQLFVLIFLQKLAVMDLSVVLVCFTLSLVWLLAVGKAVVIPQSALIYAAMLVFAVFSQLSAETISTSSLLLFCTLTIVYIIAIPLSPQDHDYVLKKYSTFMILPGVLVLIQYAYEMLNGDGQSLSLDPYIPRIFLLSGYMGESSTPNWITWNRPNGMFFLEPSFCSAFLAAATIIDLQIYRRYARAAFFFVALVATNGGTGWLILGLWALGFSLSKYPLRTVIALGIVAIAGLIAQQTLTGLPLLSRLEELGDSKSSGYDRLLLPFTTIFDFVVDYHRLVLGEGAGQITAAYGNSWPIAKTMFEYGICTAVAYFLLFTSAFATRHKSPVRLGLFVVFQFTGGYLLSPVMTNLVFILCTSYRPVGIVPPASGSRGLSPRRRLDDPVLGE